MSKELLYRNEEWLRNEYVTNGRLATDIAKELGCNGGTVGRWLKKFGIEVTNHFLSIEDAHVIAKSHGGKCLSTEYVRGKHEKLLWVCSEGHEFELAMAHARTGVWCRACGWGTHDIKYMDGIAKTHGGRCTGGNYENALSIMDFVCAEGHTWSTSATTVLQGSWCPVCAGVSKPTLESIKEFAIAKGGRCLSDVYINNKSPLLWECGEGHKWSACSNAIVNVGEWCPECYRSKYKQEDNFRVVMENVFGAKLPTRRPAWLTTEGGQTLEIDGFNEELMTGFEYQGQQHFWYIEYFHRKIENFHRRVELDKLKKNMLSERGVFMLYPTYELKEEDFHKFIVDAIRREPQRDGRGHKIR